jgi:hypothetical protein
LRGEAKGCAVVNRDMRGAEPVVVPAGQYRLAGPTDGWAGLWLSLGPSCVSACSARCW